jgi:hypothetical protein
MTDEDFDDIDDENGIDILNEDLPNEEIPFEIQKRFEERTELLNKLHSLDSDSPEYDRTRQQLIFIDKGLDEFNSARDYNKGHTMGSYRKVMKQFKKCKEVKILDRRDGVIIIADNGEKLSMHRGSLGRNVILRDWVKKNTSMKFLRI